MGSVSEGLFTVEVKDVSKLETHCKSNGELLSSKSFGEMHYVEAGPFTLGNTEFKIRVYPAENGVAEYHLLLLSQAELVKKYCYICLRHYQRNPIRVKPISQEKKFQAGAMGEGLDLPMVLLVTYNFSVMKSEKDDSFRLAIYLRLILDDSSKVPATTNNPQRAASSRAARPRRDPNQPGASSSNSVINCADIFFVFGLNKKIYGHKALFAAASSVFRSEFGALKDDVVAYIRVQHMDEPTFQDLRDFIYSKSLPSDLPSDYAKSKPCQQERYRSLFIAAHRFKVEGLETICEKIPKAVTDCILSTLAAIKFQHAGLLKIVHTEPKRIGGLTKKEQKKGSA